MGYTHYWYRPAEIDRDTYNAIVFDFGRMFPALKGAGVILADGGGKGDPLINANDVCFNGPENCGHPKNHEISIPWPSAGAGGVMDNHNAIDGSWFAGTTIEHRCCNGNCSYETFDFPRVMEVQDWSGKFEGGLHFECTKTAFRPYDLAVNVFLIIAKHHMSNGIRIMSDGEEAHWFDGKLLCAAHLGYGLEFALTDERPKEAPEAPTPYTAPVVRYDSAADTAKAIRESLKASFPGFKFSVRSKEYSGGSSVNVRWTDGPTAEKVRTVTNSFESVSRDRFGEILSGGNRYIFADRDYSSEFEARILAQYRKEWGKPDFDPNTAAYDERHWYCKTLAETEGEGDMPKAERPTKKQDKPTPAQKPAPVQQTPAPTATTTLGRVGAWTWLTFATKPSQDLLDTLKAAGWRWSNKRSAWYNLEGALPPSAITYSEQSA